MKSEILISSIPYHWPLKTIIEIADNNGEPCDMEITRSDESGSWGVKVAHPRAEND